MLIRYIYNFTIGHFYYRVLDLKFKIYHFQKYKFSLLFTIVVIMNVDEEQVMIQHQVQEVRLEKHTSEQEKNSKIKQLRASRVGGTDSSFKVITSVANTMIGSSMIVFPILFIKDGLFSSLIALMTVCVIQYATCRLLLIHNKPDEPNFNKQILRILGYKWWFFNSIVNITLLFFVCIGYYLLIVNNLYMVSKTVITFDGYSQKWAAVISTLICVSLIFMKEIDMLLKFFKYTIYCVIAFGIFIAMAVIKEIAEGNVDYSKFQFFSSDFSSVAGTFALSFLIHPVAAPILKKNVNQKNNKRDLLFGYILTAFIYFFVGFVGSLSCSEYIQQIIDDKDGKSFTTVFSCFDKKQTTEDMVFFVIGKIVQFGVLVQNVSVMPILHFLTRNQLLDFYEDQGKRKKIFYIESWIFLLASLGTALLQINVSLVLSLDGAIVGFFMAYGIPIWMHLKCYHFKPSLEQKRQLKKSLLNSDNDESIITGLDFDKLKDEEEQNQNDMLCCNKHPSRQKISHITLYGFIMCIGVALGVFKIYAFFQ